MSERKQISESDGLQKEWMVEAKKQTMATLPEFLRKLTEDYSHDYGTICHAIAAAAIGAAEAVQHSPEGGITGFQAGAVMWEMIRGWGVWGEGPKRIQCFHDLLYPQHESKFRTISKETADWLKAEAIKEVAGWTTGHPGVIAHMRRVAEGWIPFGLTVESE